MNALQRGTDMAQLIQIFRQKAIADDRLTAMVFGRRGADICQPRKQREKSIKAHANPHELQDRLMACILATLIARQRLSATRRREG